MTEDTRDFLLTGFLAALMFCVLIGGILLFAQLSNNYSCHRYGNITGRDVRPAFPSACYVKTANGWFTIDQVRDLSD
jgi:hypothetical protein